MLNGFFLWLLRVAVEVKSYPFCPFVEAKPGPVILIPPNRPAAWIHPRFWKYYGPVSEIIAVEFFDFQPLVF